MTKIQNASQFPKRFYGLHMAEGCAYYVHDDNMIFVNNENLKKMDKTYEGKPVFVGHRDEVAPDIEPDGHVIKSFYNKADGKHWVEFLVTSDDGLDAIENKKFRLSNAYHVLRKGLGGRWHGIDYASEILEGEYDHLALVPDPRYDESVILTPSQFQEYNDKKEADLKMLNNSINKTGVKSMFNFFKKEKVENSIDLESMSVVLPKSKKEVDISRLINEADEKACNEDMPEYAVEHMLVKLDDEEVSVAELVNRYKNMMHKEEEKEENEEEVKEEEKKENLEEDKKEEEKKEINKNSILNAEDSFLSGVTNIDLSMDKVARGKTRYGSK